VIVEQALLQVRPGEEAAFEAALHEARPLIEASPGFMEMAVRPAVAEPGLYLLLVSWRTVADHRDGFRKSDRYEEWRRLLHCFYDPIPIVRYFGDPL